MNEENPHTPDKSREEEVLEDLKDVGEAVEAKISPDEENPYAPPRKRRY